MNTDYNVNADYTAEKTIFTLVTLTVTKLTGEQFMKVVRYNHIYIMFFDSLESILYPSKQYLPFGFSCKSRLQSNQEA